MELLTHSWSPPVYFFVCCSSHVPTPGFCPSWMGIFSILFFLLWSRCKMNVLCFIVLVWVLFVCFLIYSLYFWLCWFSLLWQAFSSFSEWGLLSNLGVGTLHFRWLLLFHLKGNCGTRAYLPLSMWNLSGQGIEPMSLALAGRF